MIVIKPIETEEVFCHDCLDSIASGSTVSVRTSTVSVNALLLPHGCYHMPDQFVASVLEVLVELKSRRDQPVTGTCRNRIIDCDT